jgi:hypothetical protein
VSYERESLTRWAAKHNVYGAISQARGTTNVAPGKRSNVAADNGATRKIQLMCGCVYRIELNGCYNVETGLFESKRQASDASK